MSPVYINYVDCGTVFTVKIPVCRNDFGMGPTLQLDDYPYVHLMHRIDDELRALGHPYCYYQGPTRPFKDNWTWAVLIALLNEDYANLLKGRQTEVSSASQLLFDRLDAAHALVGMPEPMGELPYRIRKQVAAALESGCRAASAVNCFARRQSS